MAGTYLRDGHPAGQEWMQAALQQATSKQLQSPLKEKSPVVVHGCSFKTGHQACIPPGHRATNIRSISAITINPITP